MRSPKCWINGVETVSSRETTLSINSDFIHLAHSLFISTTFFYYLQITSNGRDLNPSDIGNFPTPKTFDLRQITNLSISLEKDYFQKSRTITMQNKLTGEVKLESLTPSHSKEAIDNVDVELAKSFNFTDEELDFIINYDIKYRMGRDAAEETDGA
jgi:hypothetical protein